MDGQRVKMWYSGCSVVVPLCCGLCVLRQKLVGKTTIISKRCHHYYFNLTQKMCVCVCLYALCLYTVYGVTIGVHALHSYSATIKWLKKKRDNNHIQNGMPSVEYMIIMHNGCASSYWAFFTIEIQKRQRPSQHEFKKKLFFRGQRKRLAKRRWMTMMMIVVEIFAVHRLHVKISI